MKAELDDALCRDFPLLYADRQASARSTCMCWGFDVPDAWEPAIRRLSEKLECLIADEPADEEGARPKASQVKEKFGTLRFYMTWQTDAMDELIKQAEHQVKVLHDT